MTDHPKPLQSPARNSSVTTHTPTNTLREKCRVTSTTTGGVKPQVPMYGYSDEGENRFDSIDHRPAAVEVVNGE